MKIAEYNEMMAYLTRPEPEVLPQPKPQELLDIQEENRKGRLLDSLNKIGGRLEDSSLDFIRRQNFNKKGLAMTPDAIKQRKFREKNPYKIKTTDILVDGVKYTIPNNAMKPESAKSFIKFLNKLEKDSSLENYKKLIAKESKPIQKVIRSYRAYLQNEKAGAFATGSGENLKKLFDELKLPNKSKNFLSKVTSKDIKGQIVQTATKAAGEAKKNTSMNVANAVRDIFVNDPNNAPGLDDIAEGLEGSPKWNAASEAEKIKMRTTAKNSVNTFLEAVTADRKVKGFKDIAPETLGDIIQYIDDNKRGEFGFSEGLIRDYKIKLRDSLIKGDFAKQRRNIPGQKGKVIDEVFGLSATFENAPAYTENIQFISDEANKLKRTQIDKPFSAILKAVIEGRDAVTFDKKRYVPISEAIKNFNAKSKTFGNVNKISTPQILIGDNLDVNKLVSNFKDYSPQAQKNILDLAADKGFVLTSTKPATPVGKLAMQPDGQIKKLIASVSPNPKCRGNFSTGGSPPDLEFCFKEGEKAINDLKIKPGGSQYRNFVKLGQVLAKTGKTAAGAADILLSVGAGPQGLAVGVLLETGFAAEQLSKGQPGIAFSKTILGDLYNAVMPDEAEFSVGNRLLKSAKTEEEKVVVQNVIDFNKDQKLFKKKLNRFDYLSSAPDFETEGVNLDALKKELVDLKFDLDNRAPKVRNRDSAKILSNVSYRVGEEGRDLLKGFYGKIFGDRQLTDKSMQTPVLAKSFFKAMAPQPSNVLGVPMYEAPGQVESTFDQMNLPTSYEATPEEIDANFDMQGGIMAASGGRIGYSNGSEGTALAIEESLEAFQRYLKAGGKLGYKDFIALGNEGVSKFFNSGGRVGFADGPDNPGRRKFMKLAAGLASIPILGKFFKGAKVASLVKPIPNSSTVMPDWFPNFVDKFVGRSIGKKIDADLMEYTNPDLPNIKLTRKDDGSLLVEGTNEHNQAYNITYEPPGYELIDEKTGKAVKTKGEFEAVEGRHVALGPEDYDTDAFYADELDELYTSDIADMEKYTTGNVTDTAKDAFGRDTGLKKGMYDSDMAQGRAENQADILRDEGLDEID